MKSINVTKMQGLGNDFVIVDYEEYQKSGIEMSELALMLCNRNFGVGADGMFIPNLSPKNKQADIGWYFYNSDGSIAQMCGNGIRCFARYVYDKKLITKKKFKVETLAGIIEPELIDDDNVRVNMSMPILNAKKIPFNNENILNYEKEIDDKVFYLNAVSMGNPHCVIFTEKEANLLDYAKNYGPILESDALYPQKTNVEFAKVLSSTEIDMCVYERGCGITLACGTGACATVVAGILNNLTENNVSVNLPGGALNIEWQGSQDNTNVPVYMTGPAKYSFFAEYLL